MDRRLKRLEDAVKDLPADGELIDVTDQFYDMLDRVYGPDPSRERKPMFVTQAYLDLVAKIYGDKPDKPE